MKRLLTFFGTLAVSALLLAQTPQSFGYQAVVRSANGQAVSHQSVSVRVSLLHGAADGAVRYTETHAATTNAVGLFTIAVGDGTTEVDCHLPDCVDLTDGLWCLRTEVDPSGGTTYSLITTQQLLSVPYALYAANAGNLRAVEFTLDSLCTTYNGGFSSV